MIERKIDYIISSYPSKSEGYQMKRNKGLEAKIKLFISNIWNNVFDYSNNHCNHLEIKTYDDFFNKTFNLFVERLNTIIIIERYCLELSFSGIKIKNGKCNPCCINNITNKTIEWLYDEEKAQK